MCVWATLGESASASEISLRLRLLVAVRGGRAYGNHQAKESWKQIKYMNDVKYIKFYKKLLEFGEEKTKLCKGTKVADLTMPRRARPTDRRERYRQMKNEKIIRMAQKKQKNK